MERQTLLAPIFGACPAVQSYEDPYAVIAARERDLVVIRGEAAPLTYLALPNGHLKSPSDISCC
jgi:hypothetical protein